MSYVVRQNDQSDKHPPTLAAARTAAKAAADSWRKLGDNHAAPTRRDPDSPLGYRYVLKRGGEAVGFIAVDEVSI